MAGVVYKHPQTSYALLLNSLQYKLHFVQHVNPDIGKAFHPVEDAPREAFLSSLFRGATSRILRRVVIGLPVNQYGIAIIDPTQTTGSN